MNNVISFLEKLGKNADLRLDRVDLESLLNDDDFAPEIMDAILDKDQPSLEMLLKARSKIVCLIVTPDEEESGEEEPAPEESDPPSDLNIQTAQSA